MYKSVKNGDVKALPETTRLFYNESDAYIRFASERYSQDHLFYDRSDNLTTHLMNKDYKKAQKVINDIESDLISRAGKKSPYYKYQKQHKPLGYSPSGIFYKKFQKPIDIFYFMYYNINIVTNKKYIKRKVNGD